MEVFGAIATLLGIKVGSVSIGALTICAISLINFTALGYFGGELVSGAIES